MLIPPSQNGPLLSFPKFNFRVTSKRTSDSAFKIIGHFKGRDCLVSPYTTAFANQRFFISKHWLPEGGFRLGSLLQPEAQFNLSFFKMGGYFTTLISGLKILWLRFAKYRFVYLAQISHGWVLTLSVFFISGIRIIRTRTDFDFLRYSKNTHIIE